MCIRDRLSRELAAGYVVASPATADRLREVRAVLGVPVSAVTQRAIALLLDGGVVRRNTQSVHRELARRRSVLSERVIPALERSGAEARLAPGDGADVTVRFPTVKQRDEFESSLLTQGVECGRESALWTGGGDGLVLSFAHLGDADFTRAVDAVLRHVATLG